MGEIDVKEFHSLSLSTVHSDNGLSWSEDHKISFITSTALHILEVAPCPSVTAGDMCLKRSVIKPPDDVPTTETGINVDRLLYLLDQRNAYRLVLDVKLAPNLTETKPCEPRFIKAIWSPGDMYQEQRCIIATLTSLGCLKLFAPYTNTWVEIADVSKYWTEHCKLLWPEEEIQYSRPKIDVTFTTLQNRASQLKITAMVWGEIMNDPSGERFTLLITISHSGLLALWKLKHLVDLGNPAKEYKPILMKTCDTNLYNSGALHWLRWKENLISVVIGDTNGCVKIATFCLDSSNEKVITCVVNDIWNEEDRLQVSCINSLPTSSELEKEERVLCFTKNSYLLVFLITSEGVISSCVERTGGLSITGLEMMDDKTFVICSLSGNFVKYTVNVISSYPKPTLSLVGNVLTSNISWHNQACFGITKCYNKHVWAITSNMCVMYDHLMIRRPSKLSFVTFRGMGDPIQQLRDDLLSDKPVTSLFHHWESLEVMRMGNIKLQKTQSSKSLNMLQDVDKLSSIELQLELWRARTFVAQQLNSDIVVRNPEACAYVTLLEELILCRHACKSICWLFDNQQESIIDDSVVSTLRLLQRWLQIWLSYYKIVDLDKNSDTKSITSSISCEMNDSDSLDLSNVPQINSSVSDVNESIIENDGASVGSFDDAMSTDSNGSYSLSARNFPKHLHSQQGRMPSNFLKPKLNSTCDAVTNALLKFVGTSNADKEICVFCEVEITMDVDWRFAICPANHRLSRCCKCLRPCHQMPHKMCSVCPAVACSKEGCNFGNFCTFCGSLLIVDEKFKKPGFQPLPERPSEEKEKEMDQNEDSEQFIKLDKPTNELAKDVSQK